jgi:glycosyltransferase involved in cell wall biosynthesis
MTPLISVIMAVYNAERYLDRSIDSILGQSLENYELIVVNDASTDDSKAKLDAFRDPRIRLLNGTERLGLTKSLNMGIEYSRGRYIARMDADDIAHPDRLEKQLSYLMVNSDTGIVGTNFYEIDESDSILGEVYLPQSDKEIRRKIFRFNPFCHSSVMIPRKVFETIGLYEEEFMYAQDYELWFRILEKYKGANLDDLLMKRRKHVGTLSWTNIRVQSCFAYRACVLGKHHIHNSFADQIWMFKHRIIGGLPVRLSLLVNRLKWHNFRYLFLGYYRRNLR